MPKKKNDDLFEDLGFEDWLTWERVFGEFGKSGYAEKVINLKAAHIFGHNSGMQLIDNFGFDNTWSLITILGFIGVLCLWILIRVTNKEKNIV